MELGAGCLALLDSGCDFSHQQLFLWHFNFSWSVMFASLVHFFASLSAYEWTGPGQAALYGDSVACRQVVFIRLTLENLCFSVFCCEESLFSSLPPLLSLETHISKRVGALLSASSEKVDVHKRHPMDLLKHTAQVPPNFCLFFHFVISSLP